MLQNLKLFVLFWKLESFRAVSGFAYFVHITGEEVKNFIF